jgi:hypothetical protein
MSDDPAAKPLPTYHRFLDEMGDTTFYGTGRKIIIGQQGVSLSFGMGIVKFARPVETIREEVRQLQAQVTSDALLNSIPSVRRRIAGGGFFFHASKDTPDVRSVFLHYLRELPCEVEAVVARKIPALFEKQHQGREEEFYCDLLSHLIKRRVKRAGKLVLNVAARGSSTREKVLLNALALARLRAGKRWDQADFKANVVFNIQTPLTEPLLTVADYLCWAVQRVFETGETRFYDYLHDKIRLVVDLYDAANYDGHRNYYDRKRPLTSANKLSPPIT